MFNSKKISFIALLVALFLCKPTYVYSNSIDQQLLDGKTPQGLSPSEWRDIQQQINGHIESISSYPVAKLTGVDPEFQQTAYIKASNTEAFDNYAYSVAISGNTLVVGAPFEDSDGSAENDNSFSGAGAVYVFVRNAGGWTQQAYLKASNTDGNDLFGGSVAISGDVIVIGARGEDSGATGVNGNQLDNTFPESGAAYVFARNAGIWNQQAYLKPSAIDSGDEFGYSVGISGDTIVISAIGEDSNAIGINNNWLDNSMADSGAAYVFTFAVGSWGQRAYIKPNNTDAGDFFGSQVDVFGDRLVVGAHREDSSATGVNGNWFNNTSIDSGAAYIFDRAAGLWSQQAYLKASNTDAADLFGLSVAVDANTVVVGAIGEDSNSTGADGDETDNSTTSSGAVYVFKRDAGNWLQKAYLKPSNTDAFDFFGYSVAVFNNNVLVGSSSESSDASGINGDGSNNLLPDSGAAYLFTNNSGFWSQKDYFKASNPDKSDLFGFHLALTAETAIIGAIGESSMSVGVNADETDNSVRNSGAVYIFDVTIDDVIFSDGFE